MHTDRVFRVSGARIALDLARGCARFAPFVD